MALSHDHLRAVAEAAARIGAPGELAPFPVYVILSEDLPESGTWENFYGLSGPTLDAQYRERIGERWRGRGPAVFVNDKLLIEDLGQDAAEAAIVGAAVHEFAHSLAWLEQYQRPADPVKVAWQAALAKDAAPKTVEQVSDAYLQLDFKMHGAPTFLRSLLHMAHRINASGIYVPLGRVFRHPRISSIYAYHTALDMADEFENMADASVAQIIAAPMPDEYRRLWESDSKRFETAAMKA